MLSQRPLTERVDKPWGKFERYAYNEACTVKIITVAPGGTLSPVHPRLSRRARG